jgi:hypothetical protein
MPPRKVLDGVGCLGEIEVIAEGPQVSVRNASIVPRNTGHAASPGNGKMLADSADPQRSATRVAHLLEVVVDLHHYRDHMPSGGLDLLPWKGRSAFFVAGAPQTRGENRTPRLPEAVISPLLTWSLKYITVFAADILAARAELEVLQVRQQALIKEDRRFSEDGRRQRRCERLVAYLDEPGAHGRGVPIWTRAHNGVFRKDDVAGAVTPPINAHLIHLHVGIDAQSEPAEHVLLRKATKRLVLDAVAAIGIEPGGMDTPITIDRRPAACGAPGSMPRRCSSRSACCRPPATSSAPT